MLEHAFNMAMNSFHQGAVVFKHHGEGDQEDQVVWQKWHFGHSTTFDFQSSWASYERGSIAPTSFLGYKCKATGPSLKSLAISMKTFGGFGVSPLFSSNQWFLGTWQMGIFLYFGSVRVPMGLRSLQWRFSDFRRIIKEPQFARFTSILVAQEFSCFHEILPLQQAHWKPEQPAGRTLQVGATFPKLQGARRIGCESYHFGNENSCHSPTWIGGQASRQADR